MKKMDQLELFGYALVEYEPLVGSFDTCDIFNNAPLKKLFLTSNQIKQLAKVATKFLIAALTASYRIYKDNVNKMC